MHNGSCHCGAVAFRVDGEIDHVIECKLLALQSQGLLLWFVARDTLHVERGEATLGEYRFNKHVIQHLFCATCGCQPFGLGTGPDGQGDGGDQRALSR